MRLHLVGLPHTQTTAEQTVCAFTQKLVKFCEMMEPFGHEMFVYSGEHNEAPCTEHVVLFSDAEQEAWYPGIDQNMLPDSASWDSSDECWRIMNIRAVSEISKRTEKNDIIMLLGGHAQKFIADNLPNISCEWAVGYDGFFSERCCFESYAWRHYMYAKRGLNTGRWYDTVIPNFFRPDDFKIAQKPSNDYLLFVGRMIWAKGIKVAEDIAREAGYKLVCAGSGVKDSGDGWIETTWGERLEGDVEYVGPVDAYERNRLMGNALATLVPTMYIEPFGAVAVESQLCGTPAVTTDWGAFPETVPPEFRFRYLGEAVECIKRAKMRDAKATRGEALAKFSLSAVGYKYNDWFTRLLDLWESGWYSMPKEGTHVGVS